MATTDPIPSSAPSTQTQTEKLPKLSLDDFRVYDKLAVMMNAYHNHFRHTWTMLYTAASEGTRPRGMSLRTFINTGLALCRQLTGHHQIEETYIFPELAQRMPIFTENELLIKQHEQIHDGIEKLEAYLRPCIYGEKELRMEELKSIMDSFGTVLWEHLDKEVETLGAENMRRYWTKDEIRGMNW